MNIILYNGGTSKHNTKLITEKFREMCESKGHNVFYLDEEFRDCLACRSCYNTRKCCIGDILTDVISEFPFDAIVIGTPIYFFQMSAKARSFLDRFYSTSLDNKIIGTLVIAGSPYEKSGVDLIDEAMQRSCNYCGAVHVPSFFKCTHDEYTGEITDEDNEALEIMIANMEVLFDEIKENR